MAKELWRPVPTAGCSLSFNSQGTPWARQAYIQNWRRLCILGQDRRWFLDSAGLNCVAAGLTGLSEAVLRTEKQLEAAFGMAECIEVDLRGANLSRADLSGANLSRADLRGANLSRADLSEANVLEADLRGANLREAGLGLAILNAANLSMADIIRADLRRTKLFEANLSRADLSGADLSMVDLTFANLYQTILSGTEFTQTQLYGTVFGVVDLSSTKGLDSCDHLGPCVIDYQTLAASKALPLAFLRGCGLPDHFIDYLPSLIDQPIQYYSCFISYSSKDEEFTQRLHSDLQDNGVRCWYAPEDMKIGDKIRPRIDEVIRSHQKLLLDSVLHSDTGWAADIKRSRLIGDFRLWKDHDNYKKAFDRLLRDLKADAQ